MSASEIRQVAERYWPAREVDKAVRVALCESEGEWWSDHSGIDRRYGAYRLIGLWQIEATIWTEDAQRMAGPDMDLRDPRTNAAVAAFVWSISGWAAWPHCGRGV